MARHQANMAERGSASEFTGDKAQLVYRLPKVTVVTGRSRTAVYQMLDYKSAGYDPLFPRPFALSRRTVGWLAHEVHAWVEARAATRL